MKKEWAIVWEEGKEPSREQIFLLENGDVELCERLAPDDAYLILVVNHHRFPLGYSRVKKEKVKLNEWRSSKRSQLDHSAIGRFQRLLQKRKGLELKISSNQAQWTGMTDSLTEEAQTSFFKVQAPSCPTLMLPDVEVTCDLSGVSYDFSSYVMGREEDTLFLSLPTRCKRRLTRAIPRERVTFRVRIGDKENTYEIENLSTMGCAIKGVDSDYVNLWQVVTLSFDANHGSPLRVTALVVSKNEDKLHVTFDSAEQSLKKRFMKFFTLPEPFGLKEDPEATWYCLSNYGYTELLEEGLLNTVRKDCVEAWQKVLSDREFFFPVLQEKDKPVGTIGCVQSNHREWTAHALSTEVNPKYVSVTSALYSAWPTYILSAGEPSHIYTWYDADKPWHNRFYRVFIEENRESQEVDTFVRQWWWSPNPQAPSSHSASKAHIEPAAEFAEDYQRIRSEFLRWLPKQAIYSPLFPEDISNFWKLHHGLWVLYLDDSPVAISRSIHSELELNPFSVLNSFHLFVPNPDVRLDPHKINALLSKLISLAKDWGLPRLAISVDYDVNPEAFEGTKFERFANIRCMSTSTRYLTALMANNIISFLDIETRKSG